LPEVILGESDQVVWMHTNQI